MKTYYCNLCGAKCEYEHGKMPRVCPGCEAIKHRLYYLYEKKPPESFPTGDKIKQLCMERDGNKCVMCGAVDNLSVHHKDGNSYRKVGRLANNNLANLITLCNSCHTKIHHEQGDIKKQGKAASTLAMIEFHAEHPELRQAELARRFNLSRERVGQILGRVRKNKNRGY